ncbi:MAG TPA: M55 family metallopeptidase [Planctomycetota bacterium]|nr:M55 family metallopeptidase [Planctomycetota bacterium]
MKVFITVDLEGVSGYARWDAADRPRERELITDDANAAAAGCFDAGADEVVVGEAHGNMRNLIPERLDPRARFVSGEPKPLNHMAGLDSSFDAAMLVGYHAKAGTLNAVMCHTYSLSVFSLRFNGAEVGELGTDAAIAGHFGVPVVLVAGDEAACREARDLLGAGVQTVAVKKGLGRFVAEMLPLEAARAAIRAGAAAGLRGRAACKPFVVPPPVRVEVTFTSPSHADALAGFPGLRRVDGCTVAHDGAADFLQAHGWFDAAHFLAGARG